jgi:hypothetical protein
MAMLDPSATPAALARLALLVTVLVAAALTRRRLGMPFSLHDARDGGEHQEYRRMLEAMFVLSCLA